MKNMKINYLTYYFFIIFLMCGLIKNAIIIFIIVFFHELGHLAIAHLCKYKIISMTLYPFGGITKLEKNINSPIYKDLFLALGGIFFQIILLFIFYIFLKFTLISNKTYFMFLEYNKIILFFNLLPIEPLDGAKIMDSLLTNFFSYKVSLKINLVLSCAFLSLFIAYNYAYSVNNYMIIFFLIFKILEYKKNINNLYNRFLMERYLYSFKFKKIKNLKVKKISVLKKNIYFYFWNKDSWISEKNLIAKYFKK